MNITHKLKTGLLFSLCSLLRPVIRTSGEGEGRAAGFPGGGASERAGAAPEGPGPAGTETAGLLSGRMGQSPSVLPRRSR